MTVQFLLAHPVLKTIVEKKDKIGNFSVRLQLSFCPDFIAAFFLSIFLTAWEFDHHSLVFFKRFFNVLNKIFLTFFCQFVRVRVNL